MGAACPRRAGVGVEGLERVASPQMGSEGSRRGAARQGPEAVAAEAALRECVICIEAQPLAEFPGRIALRCDHERDVCRTCVRRAIELEVTGKGNSTRILCPHKGCPSELEYADVLREASRAVFERFDQLLLQQVLQTEPGFRWCAHAGCGSGQIVADVAPGPDAGRNIFLRCHCCQQRTCVHHRCAWHAKRTCKEYDSDARHSEEVALLQYLEREDVKRCPKCNHGIEQNGGCDHMTCKKSAGGCGAEFCTRCLADYNGPNGIWVRGNSAHKESCRYYFPNPEEQ